MSTKMYDLYCYTAGDIFHLWDWLPVLRQHYTQHVVAGLTPLGLERSALYEAIAASTKAGYRGLFNVEASVVVYCDYHMLFVQFFGVPEELLPEGLIDCHYQDQSDRPEGVSDAEWNERRLLADRLLGRDYADRPGHAGLVYVLADGSDAWHIADQATR